MEIPPLNVEAGQKWLVREIDLIKPDMIIFDNIMSLLVGDLMKPEAWQPILPLMRYLSKRYLAQIWLHHANDLGKVFGDKTRTWQMDTVLSLLKVEDDDTAIKLEFTKHRLLTKSNREQFRSVTIYPGEGWRWEATSNDAAPKGPRTQKIVEREFCPP